MDSRTTQRIVSTQLRDTATGDAAVRWVARFPGVLRARLERESAEVVVTYDLCETTLAEIRRHLERGGVSCEGSLIQRCHLAVVDRAERAQRRRMGLAPVMLMRDLPLVSASAAA